MKTEIENGNEFQNETQTPFQNENEPVIGIENETELQNEIEIRNEFQNENETQNELQNGFQNETEVQNELKMNSQNELGNQSQNELQCFEDFNRRYNQENCIELLWYDFAEHHNLKPIMNTGTKKGIPNGFITAQNYQTDWAVFHVEKTWITETERLWDKKMIELKITKINGE